MEITEIFCNHIVYLTYINLNKCKKVISCPAFSISLPFAYASISENKEMG